METLETKEGGHIGRVLVAEFKDSEVSTFEKVMEVLEGYSDVKKYKIRSMLSLSFHGLKIMPERRKVYCDKGEISLTAKEFDILYLLAENQGRVLTYAQIYQNVWGDYDQNIQNNSIGSHVCSLREKLYAAVENPVFRIRCVREVGYCFEVRTEEPTETV